MEISIDQKNISCRKEVFRQTKMIQEHADCIIPDRYEDIAKLAFTETQLFLKGKELNSHGVSVTGSAEINLFYIAEGSNGSAVSASRKTLRFILKVML